MRRKSFLQHFLVALTTDAAYAYSCFGFIPAYPPGELGLQKVDETSAEELLQDNPRPAGPSAPSRIRVSDQLKLGFRR